ncbi:MAG: hypothetical protein RMK97_07315 [Sutterellaceae bacterium]|nr:hypothetical protein [Burkholderiaceae bacterium]MDW8430294.1 hypothetical protein [Sutterellaceae bacterium]
MLKRTRSRWFERGKPRTPEAIASVAAFTAWRLALESIKRMRRAQFEIEADAQYFAYLRDYLILVIHIADRLAAQKYAPEQRVAFTTAMVKRLAVLQAENQSRLLGDDEATVRRAFIDAFNEQADDYATLDFGAAGPLFPFARYCAHRLLDAASERDRAWLIEQIVSIEAPEAVHTLRQVIDNLFATASPPS